MSGGYFEYQEHIIKDFAYKIDGLTETNYPPEIIAKFKEASHCLKQASEMAHRIDWLISGDDGEEDFLKRWDKEVRAYYSR